MKKTFLFLAAVLLLLCLSTYIFIPKTLVVTSSVVIGTSEAGTERFVLDTARWHSWWNDPQNHAFVSGSDSFRLTERLYKSAKINVTHDKRVLKTDMVVIPLSLDSTGIEWKFNETASLNPFTRFVQYREALKLKQNLDTVLGRLRQFLSSYVNVYGIPITRTSINDTAYAAARTVLRTQPRTPDIYALIKKVQSYISQHRRKQTGSPIYNVTKMEDNAYQLMVAVPVDTLLQGNTEFLARRMVRGAFMVTEVTGGEASVDKASKALQQFFTDFRRTSMAMDFAMLITDRMYQPDTSKWITRLYKPVY